MPLLLDALLLPSFRESTISLPTGHFLEIMQTVNNNNSTSHYRPVVVAMISALLVALTNASLDTEAPVISLNLGVNLDHGVCQSV